MADSSRERARVAKAQRPQAQMLELAKATVEPPPLTSHGGGFDLIAEVKLRSPAAGLLKPGDENVGERVTRYASAGAAAISVLTEPTRFDGAMSHLEQAARALAPLRVPAMRKDFLVDPYQVIEARAAGAGGVLIILRMLPRETLEALIEQALALNLFSLLEAFDEQDIELAHSLVEKYAKAANGEASAAFARTGSRIRLLVGVNCRDLVTLKVVPGRLEALAPSLPTASPRVAESGVGSGEDAARVAASGYEFALVGSALMTAPNPHALVAEMLTAGRSARTQVATAKSPALAGAPAASAPLGNEPAPNLGGRR
jgi:indole-3-glycerol phosphate synthase